MYSRSKSRTGSAIRSAELKTSASQSNLRADPLFTEFFRTMQSRPLARLRQSIMTFDRSIDKIAPLPTHDGVDESIKEERIAETLPTVVTTRRVKPPLHVKLNRLNYSRYGELKDEVIRGKDLNDLESNTDLECNPLSPRSILLKECIDLGIFPFKIKEILVDSFAKNKKLNIKSGMLSNVPIVDDSVVSIDLHDFGLGDEKGIVLSKALALCPFLRKINISGNRFTDKSMLPILTAILSSLQCTSLNISNNKVDSDTISILKENLRDPQCIISELFLSKSDIDDVECASLMESLHENKSLQRLDLSSNRIGEMEEFNSVNPSFLSGGEAIAEMLLQNSWCISIKYTHTI